jgi:starch-binding outer membrane protein, SusD/RagB family
MNVIKLLSINQKFNVGIFVFIFIMFQFIVSCNKTKLDVKPNSSLIVPSTLPDFQQILDNSTLMNTALPDKGEAGSDDYYITTARWTSLTTIDKNTYIWAKDIYEGDATTIINDWNTPYKWVYNANIILEGLQKNSDINDSASFKNIKGSAFFYRAHAYYQLAQLFCKPFDSITSRVDLGIPLRFSADINVTSKRSTVAETYEQIISDLKSAEELLPVTPVAVTRPSKTAARALLARVYLIMGDHRNALNYANGSLALFSSLLDYSKISTTQINPISRYNSETIFWARFQSSPLLSQTTAAIDTVLFNSYSANDLRKVIFFKTQPSGVITFNGSYDASSNLFAGIANDEVYLIRAECYARTGRISEAMKDLNDLLRTRWKKNSNGTFTYIDQTATDAADALYKILTERRKELVFRGIRWTDLRRLNVEPRLARTLIRVIDNQTYTLTPNDTRYVFPIPIIETDLSGIEQNIR